jgi:vanillate/3-O-methylgallate O-demethylase
LPTTPHFRRMIAHADHTLHAGKPVGVSSGTTYSYYFRKMISLCTIDREYANIGTDVIVQWGDFGGPVKDIRARVERFPYLSEGRNRDVDVASASPSVAEETTKVSRKN